MRCIRKSTQASVRNRNDKRHKTQTKTKYKNVQKNDTSCFQSEWFIFLLRRSHFVVRRIHKSLSEQKSRIEKYDYIIYSLLQESVLCVMVWAHVHGCTGGWYFIRHHARVDGRMAHTDEGERVKIELFVRFVTKKETYISSATRSGIYISRK